ncbi:MAG: cytochrome P460 family protein [Oligoflexia bacterium]|nr:cytochrome P460 family protein [Oligoflexia bacterium]
MHDTMHDTMHAPTLHTPVHMAAIIALTAASLALTACGGTATDDTAGGSTATLDGGASDGGASDGGTAEADLATANALWSEIAGYDAWPYPDGWGDVVATPGGVHGESVQLWINTLADDVISAGAGGLLPDGAIAVKEVFSDDAGAKLSSIVTMKKISGYAPDTNDWFWVKYTPDGTPEMYGDVSGCSGCHSGGQDYLLTTTW